MAVVWATGVIFIGKLITDNSGWGLNHTIANLYKLDFALGVIATSVTPPPPSRAENEDTSAHC